MYKKQSNTLLQKLYKEALRLQYYSEVLSLVPKVLSPQVEEKDLDLAEPHSSEDGKTMAFPLLLFISKFCLLKGLFFPKLISLTCLNVQHSSVFL